MRAPFGPFRQTGDCPLLPGGDERATSQDVSIQSIRGIKGIDTVTLQNLEAVLRMQTPGAAAPARPPASPPSRRRRTRPETDDPQPDAREEMIDSIWKAREPYPAHSVRPDALTKITTKVRPMTNEVPAAAFACCSWQLFAAPAGGFAAADEASASKEAAKEYARLRQQRFYRHGSAVFDNVTRFSQMDESQMTLTDRFLRAFYEGRWDEVRTTLEAARRNRLATIYDKMLDDLTGRVRPLLTLDDFLGLADACPGEVDHRSDPQAGAAPADGRGQGTGDLAEAGAREGDADTRPRRSEEADHRPDPLHADFDELARQYLPSAAEASQIDDTEVRDEIVKFLASQEELEEFQQKQIAALWKEKASVLANPAADWAERAAGGRSAGGAAGQGARPRRSSRGSAT